MYRGSHIAPGKSSNRKPYVLLISLVLLVALAIGGTFAYLKANTDPVTNTFTPGSVPIEPVEVFDGTVKKSITIKNTGNAPALIRVALVIYPINENGEIDMSRNNSLTVPVDSNNWTEIDGYYYCNSIIAPGQSTPNLLSADLIITGYQVDVLAQSVQAAGTFNGASAPKSAWGHDFVSGAWK